MDSCEIINFVCWKWDAGVHPKKKLKFSARHVNIMSAMLKKYMHDPFRLHCVTDDPEGISPEINIVPLWNDLSDMGGCYRRLKMFSSEMRDIIGPYLVSIDLDCCLVGDITPLFRDRPDFKILKGTNKFCKYSGALWMMKAGSRAFVWDRFNKNAARNWSYIRRGKFVGTDQAYLSHVLKNEETWEHAEDGIYNFRDFLKRKRDLRTGSRYLPGNARIVLFNGLFDPSQAGIRAHYRWVLKAWKKRPLSVERFKRD